MTPFPEDIRKKAETTISAVYGPGFFDPNLHDAIAQALLDERERCAKVAENLIEKRRGLSLSFDMIAAAIRSPDTAQGTRA